MLRIHRFYLKILQFGIGSFTSKHDYLELAVDAYINRVNGAPCCNSYSKVEKQHSTDEQRRDQTDKEVLKHKILHCLNTSKIFGMSEVDIIIMIKELPSQNCFMFLCCYNPHPICKKGPPSSEYTWHNQ